MVSRNKTTQTEEQGSGEKTPGHQRQLNPCSLNEELPPVLSLLIILLFFLSLISLGCCRSISLSQRLHLWMSTRCGVEAGTLMDIHPHGTTVRLEGGNEKLYKRHVKGQVFSSLPARLRAESLPGRSLTTLPLPQFIFVVLTQFHQSERVSVYLANQVAVSYYGRIGGCDAMCLPVCPLFQFLISQCGRFLQD